MGTQRRRGTQCRWGSSGSQGRVPMTRLRAWQEPQFLGSGGPHTEWPGQELEPRFALDPAGPPNVFVQARRASPAGAPRAWGCAAPSAPSWPATCSDMRSWGRSRRRCARPRSDFVSHVRASQAGDAEGQARRTHSTQSLCAQEKGGETALREECWVTAGGRGDHGRRVE